MNNFEILDSCVNVVPLLENLNSRPNLWKADRYWANHPIPVNRDVDTIFLRMVDRPPYEFSSQEEKEKWLSIHDPWEAHDEPALSLLPEARVMIFKLIEKLEGERLGRVLINRLAPKKNILPHSDITEELVYYNRFHLILQTNDGVDFRAGDEHCKMKVGDLWWFDNTQEHEVKNDGDIDRIHLIVDIRTKVGSWNSKKLAA